MTNDCQSGQDAEIPLAAAEDSYCGFEAIVGRSRSLGNVLDQVRVVAPTESTVLIQAETGAGKELIAAAVHANSPRKDRSFIKVNCAAIPAGLLESELFGYERGAFTGAFGRKPGRFDAAHRGTLFLDEIGDLPTELQPKLLRVLQEREFERIGSAQTVRTDVRVVAATNRPLDALVAAKRFRGDLYYRLNVFPIVLPPLRERPEDIPLLTAHFVEIFSARMGKRIDRIAASTLAAMERYSWPGNIRELQNVVERAVILANDSTLRVPSDTFRTSTLSVQSAPSTLLDAERAHILETLVQSNWIIGGPRGAAAKLGVPRTTLIGRMRKLGIRKQAGVYPWPDSPPGNYGDGLSRSDEPPRGYAWANS